MNFIPDIAYQSSEKIKEFQEMKLIDLLLYVNKSSPFYQDHFKQHNIDVYSILTVEDLIKIPPTTKNEIQQRNWDFLCVPKNKIAEYTCTSGTLGKPVTIALSANDLDRLAYNEALSFACAGGTADDIFQLMLTLDRQFMAGIAYYEGIKKLGGGIVRVGPGLPAMQWDAIDRLKPTVIVGVPSFMVKLIQYAQENNIDCNATSIKRAVCIGESIRLPSLELNALGKKIKASWNLALHGTYASTEMQTAFTECSHGKGGHHHPELIIVELLDESNQPVQEGTPGEVTITTLGVEAMPLVRFKTGDMAIGYSTPCACGRTSMRLGPVIGRKQQMIKLKGTTIYPPGITELLTEVGLIDDFVIEVYHNDLQTDELKVYLKVDESLQDQAIKQLASLFQSRLRVAPQIVFESQQYLDNLQTVKGDRKLRKFIDNR